MPGNQLHVETFGRHWYISDVIINTTLVFLAAVCHVFLFLIFFWPPILGISSLVYAEDTGISPTVAISLLTAVLSGSTIALLTRTIESNLWLKLSIDNESSPRGRISSREAHKLAQWTVSATRRLLYVFNGASWPLRLGGLLLLSCTILNPILLYGVTPENALKASPRDIRSTEDALQGYSDLAEQAKNSFGDPMEVPMLMAIHNITAPPSPLCSEDSCTIDAWYFAVQAECVASQQENPNAAGGWAGGMEDTIDMSLPLVEKTVCSTFNPELCSTLSRSTRNGPGESYIVSSNFTTGTPAGCTHLQNFAGDANVNMRDECIGDFAIILGTWTSTTSSPKTVEVIDCRLSYGSTIITQRGTRPPTLKPNSFTKNEFQPLGAVTSQTLRWQETYLLPGPGGSVFRTPPLSSDPQPPSLVLESLLRADRNGLSPPASEVARIIEKSFELAALLAFVQVPAAGDLTLNNNVRTIKWRYNPVVLVILLLPLLATILVLLATSRKGMRKVKVVGYDPVGIARRAGEVLRGVDDGGATSLRLGEEVIVTQKVGEDGNALPPPYRATIEED